MSDEQKLQSLIMELRMLESYYNEMTARESAIARAIMEGRAALDALRSLSEDNITEVLVPIGGGLYIKSDTPAPDKLIVNIGADVAIEKTRSEASAYMDERLRELEKAFSTIRGQKNDVANKINSTRSQINSLVAKAQSGTG